MAKKDLAETGGGALAVPENLVGGMTIAGQDDSTAMARLHLFQGSAEENEKYGEGNFKRGDFVDTLERRKVENPTVMFLDGFTTWSRWEKGERAPIYTHTNKADVPAGDLEWSEENGKRIPPVASECVNAIVVVQGEAFPYLLRLKRTGLGAFKDTIQPNEKRRAMAGKVPGAYTLGSKDDKGAGGQPYKRLIVARMAEPSPELVNLASEIKTGIAAWKSKAAAAASEDEGAGEKPDSLPI